MRRNHRNYWHYAVLNWLLYHYVLGHGLHRFARHDQWLDAVYFRQSYCHLYSFLVSIRDWENMFSASSISIFHIYTPSHLFPGLLDDSEIEKDQIALDNYQNANDDNSCLSKLILIWFGTSSFPLMQSTQPSHTCQASIHFFWYGHLHSQTSRHKPNPR